MLKRLQYISFGEIFKYSVAVIMLVIPLYPKFPLFNIPGTYVAIRIEDFLLMFLGLLLAVYIFYKKKFGEFIRDPLGIAIILFLLAGLLSLFSGYFLTKTISLHLGFLHWARRVEYLVPLFIAFTAIRMGRSTKFYIQVIIIATFLSFIYGFGQMYFGFPVISTQNEEYSKGVALRWILGARLHSTFAGHYDLAAYIVLVFPIMLAYLFYVKSKLNQILLVCFVLLPSYWLFLQTEARVSFVAYLFGVSLTLWLLKKKKLIVPVVFVSLMGVLLFSSLGERYMRTINVYKNKLLDNSLIIKSAYAFEDNRVINRNTNPAPLSEDRSFSIRINVEWPRALRAFLKNPLVGTGYSSLFLATDNDYLRLLGEIGLVGALAFTLVILRLVSGLKSFLAKLGELSTEGVFVAGFAGSVFGFLLNAIFIDVFEASKAAIIFWALGGIAYGLISFKRSANELED